MTKHLGGTLFSHKAPVPSELFTPSGFQSDISLPANLERHCFDHVNDSHGILVGGSRYKYKP